MTQPRGTKEGWRRRRPAWPAISTCGAMADELSLLELQAPTKESGRMVSQEPRGFHCPWLPASQPLFFMPQLPRHLSDQPTYSRHYGSPGPPAVSMDSLQTTQASHLVSLLGTLWQWKPTHRAGWKHLEVNIPGSNPQPMRSVPW